MQMRGVMPLDAELQRAQREGLLLPGAGSGVWLEVALLEVLLQRHDK